MQLHPIHTAATVSPAPWTQVGSVVRTFGHPGGNGSTLLAQDTGLASMTLDMAMVLAAQASEGTGEASPDGTCDAMGVTQATDGTFLVQRLQETETSGGTPVPFQITRSGPPAVTRITRVGAALLAVADGADVRAFDAGSTITFGALRA